MNVFEAADTDGENCFPIAVIDFGKSFLVICRQEMEQFAIGIYLISFQALSLNREEMETVSATQIHLHAVNVFNSRYTNITKFFDNGED